MTSILLVLSNGRKWPNVHMWTPGGIAAGAPHSIIVGSGLRCLVRSIATKVPAKNKNGSLPERERHSGFLVAPCLCSGCWREARTIWRKATEAIFRQKCIMACISDVKCRIVMFNGDSTCYLYDHGNERVKRGVHDRGIQCFVKTLSCTEGDVSCSRAKNRPALRLPGAVAHHNLRRV